MRGTYSAVYITHCDTGIRYTWDPFHADLGDDELTMTCRMTWYTRIMNTGYYGYSNFIEILHPFIVVYCMEGDLSCIITLPKYMLKI